MSSRQKANIACGIVCFLFAAFYFYLTVNLTTAAMLVVTQVSAKFVPKLLAGLIAGLSVVLVVATLLEPAAAGPDASEETEMADNPAFYGTVAVGFLALLVWYGIGFFAIPLLIAGAMLVNRKKNPLQIICIPLVATLILYTVFFKIFSAPLPMGLLE